MSIATDEARLDDFPAGFRGESGPTAIGGPRRKVLGGDDVPEMARQMLI